MAKKKGGKKDKAKKPEESEEERLVRLEAENLAAEERARKEVEANRLALRARQLKEQQYAYINGIKIHNQWRKIMRMSKVEDLRKDIEILSQNHEREVDRKDAIIQMMDRDLEDAEGQYQMVLRQHTQVVDSLLDLQFRRMQAIEQQFLLSLKALEDEFELEKQEVIVTHTRQRKDMQDMMAAMEQEFNDAEAELRQEFESQREELKNRNSEEYNVLKIQLEGAIEELERHFEQAHQAYLQSTEQRTIAFRQFTKNDAAAARIIERRMRKLLRLQDALAHWRTKIATNSREWEDRNRSLRAEKEIMNKHYQALKSSMDRFRAQQAERLKTLSITSAACTAELKKKLVKGEQNMKLAEMCRKYETEQEKIIPFTPLEEAVPILTELGLTSTYDGEELADLGEASAAPSNSVPEKAPEQVLAIPYTPAAASEAAVHPSAAPGSFEAGEASEAAGKEADASCTPEMDDAGAAQAVVEPPPATGANEVLVDSEGQAGEPVYAEATEDAEVLRASSYGVDEANQEVQEYDYLNRFFLRYNKVVLDKAAIDGERTRLERENAELRQLLKQYLDGISVNEDVLNNPVNPLLIVNERLQLTLEERNKARAQRVSSQHKQAEQVQQLDPPSRLASRTVIVKLVEQFGDGNPSEHIVNTSISYDHAIPTRMNGTHVPLLRWQ